MFMARLRSSRVLTLAGVLVLVGGCASTPAEQDPTQIRLNDLDTRLGRVERITNNQSLLELSQRIDQLEKQLRELEGNTEVLQNTDEGLRKQQRDLYADLDRRLTALEGSVKAASTSGGPTGATVPAAPDAQSAYNKAIDVLKTGDYAAAAQQFADFMTVYPNSDLIDNAQYWIGEASYAAHDYDKAAIAFAAVGTRWPNSRKAPDALLKLGFTQFEQKKIPEARATLALVQSRFPGSDAAKLAADRLQKMPAEAH
jgi:tol-pal system protein YbgF